jgi:hypothetical protein
LSGAALQRKRVAPDVVTVQEVEREALGRPSWRSR